MKGESVQNKKIITSFLGKTEIYPTAHLVSASVCHFSSANMPEKDLTEFKCFYVSAFTLCSLHLMPHMK